jgi:hypothetical protein
MLVSLPEAKRGQRINMQKALRETLIQKRVTAHKNKIDRARAEGYFCALFLPQLTREAALNRNH